MLMGSNGRHIPTEVSAKMTGHFSRIADSADDIGSAIAALFDLLPTLKEYDFLGTNSGLADFRAHIASLKESILQGPAQCTGKSVQPETPIHLAMRPTGAPEYGDSLSEEALLYSKSERVEPYIPTELRSMIQTMQSLHELDPQLLPSRW
jgi:hypothetical protein